MSASDSQQEFVDYLVDMLQTIGPVHARRLFGGHGLFLDGLMFALVADGTLYLKADADSEAAFTEQGLAAFTYPRQGRPFRLSYFQAPEDCIEDIEAMRLWAHRACEAARRGAAAKRKR